jgi:microcystin degradation protein MlrC
VSRPRIFLAGIFHETHTFVTEVTGPADFAVRRGDGLLARKGDGSTYDGFLSVASSEGWEVVAGPDYTALPSGTVDHAVFEAFWTDLRDDLADTLRTGPVDGIWLSLHGAMVTTDCVDAEGELLARLRGMEGVADIPIFGVLDLHATATETMARHANGLVTYRENPHTDARETAARSAQLLARALREHTTPHTRTRVAPILWPPTGTATADRPMRDLEAMARRLEAEHPAVWAVNVFAGFAFSDVPDAGVAFSVVGTDDALADRLLEQLVAEAVHLRDLGQPKEWTLDEAVARIGKTDTGGPVLIVEPADNIGGGTAGDSTIVLAAFLRHGIEGAAVAIADAAAVRAVSDAAIGETRRLAIGGGSGAIGASPLTVDATLVSRSDGRFTLADPQSPLAASQGTSFDMGPSAVVRVNGVLVLLSSRKTPPFDLGQFRSQGIVPEKLQAIGVKAAVAHRQAYDQIASSSYTVATLGPCASDLNLLPYKRLREGVYKGSPSRPVARL